jgi:hypothetical protein
MKDLFVLTADSDMQALMRAVLARHRDLRIHPITFEVQRFTGRDSGMVKEGPETARVLVKKAEYSRLILVWDHHGSGWHALRVEEAVTRIQKRLDGVTWADRSAAVVVVPELEEWLWHCPATIARLLELNAAEFDDVTARAAAQIERSRERCCRERPKELFESILYRKRRRGPLPEDFKTLGSSANLANWTGSETFDRFVGILRAWFPARARR